MRISFRWEMVKRFFLHIFRSFATYNRLYGMTCCFNQYFVTARMTRRPTGFQNACKEHYRGNPAERYAARRTKLSQARQQRKEKNLEVKERTLPFPEGEEVASD